jgi:hypothetical protein
MECHACLMYIKVQCSLHTEALKRCGPCCWTTLMCMLCCVHMWVWTDGWGYYRQACDEFCNLVNLVLSELVRACSVRAPQSWGDAVEGDEEEGCSWAVVLM